MNASASQIIKCQNCGANNRVSNVSLGKQPVCGRCKNPLYLTNAHPIIITDANFSEVVEKSSLPVLLDLWAPWCGPCRLIAPVIDNLAKDLSGKVLVGKLNVDENKWTASRFSVQGIPTLLILKNGNEVERLVGVQTKEAILRAIQPFI